MIVSNACNPDPRVLMEAELVKSLGYDVEILCWDRSGKIEDSKINGISLTRARIPSTYGEGMNQIVSMFRFWRVILKKVKIEDYIAVHAHDFDTLIPSYYISKKLKIPIIFDAHEIYADMIEFHVPKVISSTVRYVEKYVTKRVNTVITVGERMKDFYSTYNKKTYVVGNYKKLVSQDFIDEQKLKIRKSLSIPLNAKVISYIGVFGEDRVLQPLMEAINETNEEVYLLIGGKGKQENLINSMQKVSNKIKYIGFVDNELINYYLSAADYIYYGLNKEFNNNFYSTPNSLFNAISLGKPLIIGDIGEIAEITKNLELGYIIDELTKEHFLTLFKNKLDSEDYQKYVSNIESARRTYSINGNKETLSEIYGQLDS